MKFKCPPHRLLSIKNPIQIMKAPVGNKKHLYFLCSLLFLSGYLSAQPYIDIVQVRYTSSPDAGLHSGKNIKNNYQYFQANATLPYIFKKDSSMLVFTPFYEYYKITIASVTDLPDNVQSLALPLNFVKPLSKRWGLTVGVIPRWNGYGSQTFKSNSFQLGGLVLASVKKNDHLEYKFGLYYNSEFSGAFFIPLAGIDWQINKRNALFGILPGNLTYEHQVSKRFYWGALFRAITNSYQAGYHDNTAISKYIRVDENQLGLYADTYLSKNIVFTTEFGHSVFRRLRFGEKDSKAPYYYKQKVNDNLYVSATLSYRLRVR